MATQEIEGMLEGLKPGKQLRRIRMYGYIGPKLPSWMSDSWLSALEEIKLECCEKITMLPPCLGRMRFLKELRIECLPCLKEIKWQREELVGENGDLPFPALEELYLYKLPEWIGWWIEEVKGIKPENESRGTPIISLPRLEHLTLKDCSKLKFWGIQAPAAEALDMGGVSQAVDIRAAFPCLKRLELYDLHKATTTEAGPALLPSSLEQLKIWNCDNMDDVLLSSFLSNDLTSLTEFTIEGRTGVTSCHLPQSMTSLSLLRIIRCNGLRTLSVSGSLASLRELTIEDCPELRELVINRDPSFLCGGLTNLTELAISGCPKLTSCHFLEDQNRISNGLVPQLKYVWLNRCLALRRFAIRAPALETLHMMDVSTQGRRCSSHGEKKGKQAGPPPAITTLLPSSLEELNIENCASMDDELLSSFLSSDLAALKELQIRRCPELTSFHLPQSMTFLTKLLIVGCPKLRELVVSGESVFLNLRDLEIWDCPTLGCFPTRAAFPCLKRLQLKSLKLDWSCGERKGKQAGLPSSLEELKIKNCACMDDELLSSFLSSGLTTLRELRIFLCPELTSCHLPQAMTSLTRLAIWRCGKLTSCHLPQAMTSLKNLYIHDCGNVTCCSLPPAPTALEELVFRRCDRLASLCFSSPCLSVNRLDIDRCPNLGKGSPSSPELPLNTGSACAERLKIRHCSGETLAWSLLQGTNPANLQILDISFCPEFKYLNDDDHLGLSAALLQLTSLASLIIHDCDQLESLPPEISSSNGLLSLKEITLSSCPLLSSLPDLRPLTSLRSLKIRGCPKLTERYKKRQHDTGNNINPNTRLDLWDDESYGSSD